MWLKIGEVHIEYNKVFKHYNTHNNTKHSHPDINMTLTVTGTFYEGLLEYITNSIKKLALLSGFGLFSFNFNNFDWIIDNFSKV